MILGFPLKKKKKDTQIRFVQTDSEFSSEHSAVCALPFSSAQKIPFSVSKSPVRRQIRTVSGRR